MNAMIASKNIIGARFPPAGISPSARIFLACRIPTTIEITVMMMSVMVMGESIYCIPAFMLSLNRIPAIWFALFE